MVVGHRGDEVGAALAGAGVRIVENPEYTAGMLTSIQRGMAAADPRTRWYLLALGDQPAVPPAVVKTLLGAATAHGVTIPLYGERRGHPILIHADFREEILALEGEGGLRQLWARHPEAVHHVPVASDAVLLDLDTPEDYEAAVRRLR